MSLRNARRIGSLALAACDRAEPTVNQLRDVIQEMIDELDEVIGFAEEEVHGDRDEAFANAPPPPPVG